MHKNEFLTALVLIFFVAFGFNAMAQNVTKSFDERCKFTYYKGIVTSNNTIVNIVDDVRTHTDRLSSLLLRRDRLVNALSQLNSDIESCQTAQGPIDNPGQ